MKHLFTILFISAFTNLSFGQCEDFVVEIDVLELHCYGDENANINLFFDGAEPYTVDITNAEGEKENSGDAPYAWFVGAGWYYIYIEDADGCVFIDSVEIIEPAEILMDLTITPATDFDACDGAVVADTVYNYQGDYEAINYDWSLPGEGGEGVTEVTDVCAAIGGGVMITDEVGCMKYFDFEVGSLAGIKHDVSSNINVFVNTQTGELNVLNNQTQNVELTLFNLAGETVFTCLVNEQSAVFMPKLNVGVYLYTVSHNGEAIQTGKLNF